MRLWFLGKSSKSNRSLRSSAKRDVKDAIAAALAVASDDEVIGDVIALASDVRHGSSRLLLLSALERSEDPRARAALVDLASDPELTKEVRAIRRRLKS
jgi:hypothetical protein